MKKLLTTFIMFLAILSASFAQKTESKLTKKQNVQTVVIGKKSNINTHVSEAERDSIRAVMMERYKQYVLEKQAKGEKINPASMESMFFDAENKGGVGDSRSVMKKAKGLPFEYETSSDPKVEMENYTKAKEKWIKENPEAYKKAKEKGKQK